MRRETETNRRPTSAQWIPGPEKDDERHVIYVYIASHSLSIYLSIYLSMYIALISRSMYQSNNLTYFTGHPASLILSFYPSVGGMYIYACIITIFLSFSLTLLSV